MVTVFWPAVTVIVPFEVTVASAGLSVKVKTFALGEGGWLGEACADSEGDGDGLAAPSSPHAAAATATRATRNPHSALGIPVQVTGAGREFIPARPSLARKPC